MRARAKRMLAVGIIAVAVAATAAAFLFHNRTQPPGLSTEEPPPGEPEKYSALVVRALEDAGKREEVSTRVARSGEMRREEWDGPTGRRALIWRPDLGKCFLIAMDRQEYVESDFTQAAGDNQNPDAVAPEAIEAAIGGAPSPVSVEQVSLPDQVIDNHPCSVTERRATFPDGHIETTRTFRARDLGGFDIRVESFSTAGEIKIVTQRRDIRTTVSDEEFAVPPSFKKVARLTGE
jgi:hypothetical protein